MTINQTILKDFILLGFSAYPHVQTFLFVVFFCLYLLTLAGNLTIMGLTWVDRSLHTPMYLFLSALSFSETCYTLTIIPKMLVDLLDRDRHISVTGCGLQMCFFLGLGGTNCIILTLMGYDRFLAICNPLRYPLLMTNIACGQLVASAWVGGFLISLIETALIFRLSYCGPNVINHFFCDISPLLNLTCSDKEEAELVDFLLALVMILLPLVAVASSYAAIIVAILRIPTAQGRHKAFSTCTSHLAVVVIYYSSTLFTYARPRAMYSFNYNKIISVLYTVIVPFLNPAIYCLRNKEVKDAFRKTMLGRCHHPREVPD
ncbi:Olfactory receptor 10X1 [Lemmus lemmus]